MSWLFRTRLCSSWYQVSAIHGDVVALATEGLSCSRKGTPNTGMLHQAWSSQNSLLKGLQIKPLDPLALERQQCRLVAGFPAGHCAVTGLSEGSTCRIRAQVESCYFGWPYYLQLRDVMGASDKQFWLCCYGQGSMKGSSRISCTQRTSACGGWNSCPLKSISVPTV
jgi:hypothetical protein